jgi:hypothetical protein
MICLHFLSRKKRTHINIIFLFSVAALIVQHDKNVAMVSVVLPSSGGLCRDRNSNVNNQPTDTGSKIYQYQERCHKSRTTCSQGVRILCTCTAPSQDHCDVPQSAWVWSELQASPVCMPRWVKWLSIKYQAVLIHCRRHSDCLPSASSPAVTMKMQLTKRCARCWWWESLSLDHHRFY